MASLKNNGGVFQVVQRRAGRELIVRLAVCNNGFVLKNTGSGWKRSGDGRKLTPEQIVGILIAQGWTVDDSPSARALTTRSVADAHIHEGAKRLRRLRDSI